MKRTQLMYRAAGAVVIAAALAGCGGGGGGGGGFFFPFPTGSTPPPDNGQPPVQVSAYDAFVAYVVALVATQQDTAEPANVAQFDPAPTSETTNPVPTQ